MIQIYTGNGKGKTTAALGQAFRALGQGKRVLLIQFMKKDKHLGEIKAGQQFKQFKIVQSGSQGWVIKGRVNLKDKRCAQKGLRIAQQAIAANKYDLIILDELNVAIEFNLLNVCRVKKILMHSPQSQEVIITGRSAHPEIVKIADLVSEIKECKHYFKKGILARAGIEY